jgi:hypothetical protein
MRKLVLSISYSAILFLAACNCALEKKSLDQLEANVKRHQADHKALMVQTNRSPDDQKDWDKHYEATFHLIGSLKLQAK